jgi:proteasome lid subunit RPN8/RPN11
MLKVSNPVYEAMREHGEETYPHECCGVMLGRGDDAMNEVVEVVPAGNTCIDTAHNRYHIAPQELIRIQRQGREKGLDIVGFYHSHPDHPAQWSPTDFAEAHWLGCSYVITAIEKGAARQTNAFRLTGESEEAKKFEPEPIEVTGQNTPGLGPEEALAG